VVAAAPGHAAAVRHLVIDPLDPTQVAALGSIGERLRTHIRGECDGARDRRLAGTDDTADC
jgi:hypothetical protein